MLTLIQLMVRDLGRCALDINNLCYLMEEPTTVTETSATILDQILHTLPLSPERCHVCHKSLIYK